ncbi:MAG: lycopene cyclase domain-containing protein [Bacteroidia bacterium]
MFRHAAGSVKIFHRGFQKQTDLIESRYTYLLVDLFCILFPFIFSFHRRIQFHKQWKFFVLPCTLTALIFIIWDYCFTREGIWGFNPRYVTGIYILNLPIEEVLFFICIPYACVFSYYSFKTLIKNERKQSPAFYIFPFILSGALIITGLFNLYRLYTSVTFMLCGVFLATLSYKKQSWLKDFFLVYAFIMVPFFISNGILTGSFTEEPVVIYNNDFNLGIRLFTIPVEDVFYGMLLLLMNVSGFEWLRTKTA